MTKFFIKKFDDVDRPCGVYFIKDNEPNIAYWYSNSRNYSTAKAQLIFLRDCHDLTNMIQRNQDFKHHPEVSDRITLNLT